MQGETAPTFIDAAGAALQRAYEHEPFRVAGLYWATVGSAQAILAVAEELRRTREGELTAEQRAALAPPLGGREREILTFLSNGRTNGEIAEKLHLSTYTVKDHASSLYRKLGARNRADAVRLAQELGLL